MEAGQLETKMQTLNFILTKYVCLEILYIHLYMIRQSHEIVTAHFYDFE